MNKHQYEIRYSVEFGRSLFGTFPSFETAMIAAAIFKKRLLSADTSDIRGIAKTVSVE